MSVAPFLPAGEPPAWEYLPASELQLGDVILSGSYAYRIIAITDRGDHQEDRTLTVQGRSGRAAVNWKVTGNTHFLTRRAA